MISAGHPKRSSSVVLLAIAFLGLIGVFDRPNSPPLTEQQRAERHREMLTREWQTGHCPRAATANLAEITLRDGSIADVEILDLGGDRIYLPRRWTGMTQYLPGPSPDGFVVRTGGSGSFEPRRDPSDQCRARRYASIPGRDRSDPRFQLKVYFPRFSTGSTDGAMQDRTGLRPHAKQGIELTFFGAEDGNPNDLPLLRMPEDAGQLFGDGWRVAERSGRHTFKRIAIDERTPATAAVPPAKAVEVLEGWALVFPLNDTLRAMLIVDDRMPVERWRPYRDRAVALYQWLRTKPAERAQTPGEL